MYFHRMFGGWELPTSYCKVTAVGKGIDRAHGKLVVHPKARKPLSWDLLTKGRRSVAEVETEGWVIWSGLMLPFHLLCRASEIRAFGNGLVHPNYILNLLGFCPELRGSAPLMKTRTASGWKVITRTVATKALR